MKIYRWTQKQRKNLKKPTLSLVHAGPPEHLYYPLNVDGVTEKGSANIKQIIIITILTLIFQFQFSFLLDKKKNQLKLCFFATSSS